MSNAVVAHRLAQAGIPIFPADSATKKPLVRFTISATTLPRGVDYFWSRYGADAVPCIHLFGAGLLVIDLDRGHAEGIDGVAAFNCLLDQYGELPASPAVRTPRGGVHLYFRQPRLVHPSEPLGNSGSRIAPGIDVRGRNGYVVAPGAIMATGEFYEGIPGTLELAHAFSSGAIPEPPQWLVQLAEPQKNFEAPTRDPSGGSIAEGRLRAWALSVLEGEGAELASAPIGTRNGRLFYAALQAAAKGGHCGAITEAEAWSALWAACVANGLIASDGTHQFRRTFYSGWKRGLENPHPGPRERLTKIDSERFAGLTLRSKQ